MKLRVISDVHEDISEEKPLQLPQDDALTLFCGDASNDLDEGIAWLKKNVKQGFVVAGNHDSLYGKYPIEEVHAKMREAFPKDGPVTFLEDDHKVVGDTVFVGGTLWTTFRGDVKEGENPLISDKRKQQAQKDALMRMNDYRKGTMKAPDGSVVPFTPQEADKRNHNTIAYIDTVCKKYPDKKIVVISHHAPTMKSVGHIDDKLKASYGSDLTKFIKSHPNIKLWVHGHEHSGHDYQIGQCRVLSNPRGYAAPSLREEIWSREAMKTFEEGLKLPPKELDERADKIFATFCNPAFNSQKVIDFSTEKEQKQVKSSENPKKLSGLKRLFREAQQNFQKAHQKMARKMPALGFRKKADGR